MKLRDYQIKFQSDIDAAFQRVRCVLGQSPTGSGKGTFLAHYAKRAADHGQRVWVLVHTEPLVRDLSGRIQAAGVDHGLVTAGREADWSQPVTVGSVRTVLNRLRAERVAPPDLIIQDEAHHVIRGNSWGEILECFPRARLLGLTATPQRLDGRGLGRPHGLFEEIVEGPAVSWLTERGYLAPARYYCPPTCADTSNIRTRAGDYVAADAAEALGTGEVFGSVVEHYTALLAPRTAVAFCCTIQHAEHVAAALTAAGIPSESLDGGQTQKHRQGIMERLKNGETKVVTSCMAISEGMDIPSVSGAILLRPTMSLALHLQQIGRALRPKPDGGDAVILDHVGNLARHGFADDPRCWSLKGTRDEQRRVNAEDRAPAVTTCPECLAANRSGISNCTACGYAFQPQDRPIREIDGRLIEAVRNGRKTGAAVRVECDPMLYFDLNAGTTEEPEGVWFVASGASDLGLVELCRDPHDAQAAAEGRGTGIETVTVSADWIRYVADSEYRKPHPAKGARTIEDLLEIERRRGYQPGWHKRVAGARLARR